MQTLLSPRAAFPFAVQLREPGGAALGDVFSFLSGLYFRGKLTYARTFASETQFVRIITTNQGLLTPDERVVPEDLHAFAGVDLSEAGEAFTGPLLRDARLLDSAMPANSPVVLLGSIATNKYVGPLLSVFGERLAFPPEFIGRGDMSRGGLLLRAARAGQELAYAPIANAVRHGKRPPKLEPLR